MLVRSGFLLRSSTCLNRQRGFNSLASRHFMVSQLNWQSSSFVMNRFSVRFRMEPPFSLRDQFNGKTADFQSEVGVSITPSRTKFCVLGFFFLLFIEKNPVFICSSKDQRPVRSRKDAPISMQRQRRNRLDAFRFDSVSSRRVVPVSPDQRPLLLFNSPIV